MFLKPFMTKFRFTTSIFMFFLGGPLAGGLSARQTASQATAQINAQVAQFAVQPVKVTATTPAPVTVGAKSQIQVGLLNADNKPVPATEDRQYEVSITPPSGKLTSQTVWIKKGQIMTQVDFSPDQAGVTSISVRPLAEGVRSDDTAIVVRPSGKLPRPQKAKSPQGSLILPGGSKAIRSLWATDTGRAQFRSVALALAPSAASPETGPAKTGQFANQSPLLHILVDNKADVRYANGKDAAVILAIYDSPDDSPAPTDIRSYCTTLRKTIMKQAI